MVASDEDINKLLDECNSLREGQAGRTASINTQKWQALAERLVDVVLGLKTEISQTRAKLKQSKQEADELSAKWSEADSEADAMRRLLRGAGIEVPERASKSGRRRSFGGGGGGSSTRMRFFGDLASHSRSRSRSRHRSPSKSRSGSRSRSRSTSRPRTASSSPGGTALPQRKSSLRQPSGERDRGRSRSRGRYVRFAENEPLASGANGTGFEQSTAAAATAGMGGGGGAGASAGAGERQRKPYHVRPEELRRRERRERREAAPGNGGEPVFTGGLDNLSMQGRFDPPPFQSWEGPAAAPRRAPPPARPPAAAPAGAAFASIDPLAHPELIPRRLVPQPAYPFVMSGGRVSTGRHEHRHRRR